MRSSSPARLLVRACEVWLLIAIAETLHGTARIAVLEPVVGDFRARQIAVFTGSLIIVGIALLFRNWLVLAGERDAAFLGAVWVGLTVAFEIILGRFVMQVSWARILEDYNVFGGGLMLFGLLAMFAAPFIALRYKRHVASRAKNA